MADLIKMERGHPCIILFYGAYCPKCRSLFSGFSEYAEFCRKNGIAFLGFSVDDDKNTLKEYLKDKKFSFVPYILKYKKGQLKKEMKQFGIDMEKAFYIPFAALFDSKGNLLKQWNGDIDNANDIQSSY